jgi:hypothetical protein
LHAIKGEICISGKDSIVVKPKVTLSNLPDITYNEQHAITLWSKDYRMRRQWNLSQRISLERYNNLSLSTSSYKSFSNRIFPTFLWFAQIYVKDYIVKLLLVEANMRTVRDIVEDVKFIFTRWRDSVDVVE